METSAGIIDHYLKGCIDRRKILIITLQEEGVPLFIFKMKEFLERALRLKKEFQMAKFKCQIFNLDSDLWHLTGGSSFSVLPTPGRGIPKVG